MRNFKVIVSSMMFSMTANAAVVGYEMSPDVIASAKSSMISLKEVHDDGSKVDVTSQFNFTYEDADPAKTEIKVSLFNGKPVLFSTIAGTDYVIKATNKSDPGISHLKSIEVVAGLAWKVALVSGNYQSGFGGETVAPLVVKALDSYNNPVAGASVKWTTPDGQVTDVVTGSNGQASLSYTLRNSAGTDKVSAALEGKTPAIFSLTVKALTSSLSKIAVVSSPTSAEQNKTISEVKVGLFDGNNSVMTSASRTVTVAPYVNSSCITPASGVLSGTTAVATVNGVATFSDLKYSAIDNIYIKATASTGEASCSRVIIVEAPAGEATALAVVSPDSAGANVMLFPYPRVYVIDDSGNVVKNSSVPVTMSSYTDSSCSVPTALPVKGILQRSTNSKGVAVFPGIAGTSAGTIYLKAQVAGLQSACSDPIEITPDITSVPDRLSFGGLRTSGVKNQIFNFRVNILNKYGIKIQAAEDEVEVSAHSDSACSQAAAGSVTGPIKVKGESGVAYFDDLTYSEEGDVYFKAKLGTISVCSLVPVVFSAPPSSEGVGSRLAWSQYPSASSVVNNPLTQQPKLQLADINGAAIAKAIPVSIELYNDGNCSIKSGISQTIWTDAQGLATFESVAAARIGQSSLRAFSGKMASDCSPPIAVTCPAEQHDENGVCVSDTYTPMLTEWSPKENEVVACAGTVSASRQLLACKRNHDQVAVSDSFCSSASLSTSWSSPEGTRSKSDFQNGSANETCLAGATEWNLVPESIVCSENYYNSNNSCIPQTFTAQWSELSSCSAEVCSGVGSGTQTSSLVGCVSDQTGNSVDNSLCADKTPPSQACDSPYGTRDVVIANGSGSEECLVGETTWSIISASIACDDTYGNYNDQCQKIPTIAEYSGPVEATAGGTQLSHTATVIVNEPETAVTFKKSNNHTCSWANVESNGQISGSPSYSSRGTCVISYYGETVGGNTNTVSKEVLAMPPVLQGINGSVASTTPFHSIVSGHISGTPMTWIFRNGQIYEFLPNTSSFNENQVANAGSSYSNVVAYNGELIIGGNGSLKKYNEYGLAELGGNNYSGEVAIGHDGRVYASSLYMNMKSHGQELFAYNGSNLTLVRDLNTYTYSCSMGCNTYSSFPQKFFVLNGATYFTASTGSSSNMDSIYRTDGTFEGTTIVADYTSSAGTNMSYSKPLVRNGYAYFSVYDGSYRRFVKFDGTNTTFLTPSGQNMNIFLQLVYNGKHYAIENTAKKVYEVMPDDSLNLVHDLHPRMTAIEAYDSDNSNIIGGKVFFRGRDSTTSSYRQLFELDIESGNIIKRTQLSGTGVQSVVGISQKWIYVNHARPSTSVYDLYAIQIID